MNEAFASTGARRAERLAGYLNDDPRNQALLADACDAAIAAGLHALAERHLATAQALGLDRPPWTFRRAQLCIAQRRLDEAAALLEGLLASSGAQAGVAHDLAYVRLLQGAADAARAVLAPWVDGDASLDAGTREALQVLWLRVLHRVQRLDEAWQWAQRQGASLEPAACGVASLVALDLDGFDAARAWADKALATRPQQLEALVTRATIALADRNTQRAQYLLEQALQCNQDDGRTWSALGLCSLQAQDLPLAQVRFERALRTMPAHIGTWHGLGWSRLLQQDLPGALAAFRQALALDRNFAESHGAVGLALALAGDRAQADGHLELARRLDPSNVTGRYARALLAGEAGDLTRLLALADRLLDRPGFGKATASAAVREAVAARRT